MFKKLTILSIFTLLTLGTLYSPMFSKSVSAQAIPPPAPDLLDALRIGAALPGAISAASPITDILTYPVRKIVAWVLSSLGAALSRLVAIILYLVGNIFDSILNYTVVNMSTNIGDGAIGSSINDAWKTLRDLANMAFIFVLIWAAIQAMLDLDTAKYKTQIKNIIIVALLINFSLFFSKVVIDAGNIATLGFYNAITQAGNAQPVPALPGQPGGVGGFSAIFMKASGIHSFFGSGVLTGLDKDGASNDITQFITYVLGSITMLIMSVVLLIATVMFIARFIILIFVLILSPLAFIGYAIPGMTKWFDQWKEALINQSFFPLYFMLLIWVAVKIIANPKFVNVSNVDFSQIATAPGSVVALFIKFSIIIGFIIGALILSKKAATSTAGFAATSGAVIAGGAWAGRKSLGNLGNKISQSAWLQNAATRDRAGEGLRSSLRGGVARAGLYASETARDGTFDVRNATVPTNVIGDAIQGTVGRTRAGRAMGLDDVNIPSVALGSRVAAGMGTAATMGARQENEASRKRVRDREATAASEAKLAKNKKAITEGATSTDPLKIADMQRALGELSDKETETLVSGNRSLLRSQNFATAISVKQLEAINKSDQFSDTEKDGLKGTRFTTINSAMATGGAGATSVATEIRALSNSELEMIDPRLLDNEQFVAELKASQIKAINDSSKFTSIQKSKLTTHRNAPLNRALAVGNAAAAQNIIRRMDAKDVVALKIGIMRNPLLLQAYTSNKLMQMAQTMNDSDIHDLRLALLAPAPGGGTVATKTWLNEPTKGVVDFPL